jgi:hypothetical protein
MAATSLSEITADAFMTMRGLTANNTKAYDDAADAEMKRGRIDSSSVQRDASIDDKLIDLDFLFSNEEDARYVLERQGRADYYFSFLLRHFKASDTIDWLKGLPGLTVSVDVKGLRSAYSKLFLRGRPMSDLVRATVVVERPEDAGRFFSELLKLEASGGYSFTCRDDQANKNAKWRVIKILLYPRGVTYKGRIVPVEVQVTTAKLHFLVKQSSWHQGYEVVRLNQFAKCREVYRKHGRDVARTLEQLRKRTALVDLTGHVESLSVSGEFVRSGKDFAVAPARDANLAMTFRNFRGEAGVHPLVGGMLYLKDGAYYWTEETFGGVSRGTAYHLEAHGLIGNGEDDESITVALAPEPASHGHGDEHTLTVTVSKTHVWIRDGMYANTLFHTYDARSKAPVKIEIFVRHGVVCIAVDGTQLADRGMHPVQYTHGHFRVGILTWGQQHGTFLKSLQVREN